MLKLNLILVLLSLSLSFINSNQGQRLPYRLPKTIKPYSYDLTIKVNINEFKFNGSVIINIEVLEATSVVVLNYKDIDVDWNQLELTKISNIDEIFTLKTVLPDPIEEISTITFNEILEVGNYSLSVTFAGDIRSDLSGLYRSSYGTDKYIATTHLQPSYTRMIFPCFDEPEFKAKFKLSVYHQPGYHVISNTQIYDYVESIAEKGNYSFSAFEQTPLMSSYLLAFVVSDYEGVASTDKKISIWSPPGLNKSTSYALDFAPKALNLLETFLDTKYQLSKLNIIGIPDFVTGAMENWGLLIYKSDYLLYANSYISPRVHQTGGLLLSHEIAHMWLGNEVTPEWWSCLWLSEGFARFFEYYITDKVETSWRVWEQFTVNNLQSALGLDDKSTVRKMTMDIIKPEEVIFDYIVYGKSGAVIRMFYEVVGEKVFQNALQKYLKARTYNTTNPDYLFEKFQAEIDANSVVLPKPFKILFESWSNEYGYPVVFADVDLKNGSISIYQKRFYVDPTMMKTSTKGNFYIPISMTEYNSSTSIHWLSPEENQRVINFAPNSQFVLLNYLQTGFYRVNYNANYWQTLIELLKNKENIQKISEANRAQLIDDIFNLGKAGLVGYDKVFDLLSYLRNEDGFVPWMSANNAFIFLTKMLDGSPEYTKYEIFLRNITSSHFDQLTLTVDLDKHVERIHRINTVTWACYSGNVDCFREASQIAAEYLASNMVVSAEVEPIVICTVAKYVSSAEEAIAKALITYVQKAYLINRDENLAKLYKVITGVGCFRNETVINSLLSLSLLTIPKIPGFELEFAAEDRKIIFISFLNGGYIGTRVCLNYLFEKYLEMQILYGDNAMQEIFTAMGPRIVSQELFDKFEQVVEKYKFEIEEVPAVNNAVLQAISTAENNLAWRKLYIDDVEKWLKLNIVEPKSGDANGLSLNDSLIFFLILLFTRYFFVGE